MEPRTRQKWDLGDPTKIFNNDELKTLKSRSSHARGDRVINWVIQNMPEGKQTIVIL